MRGYSKFVDISRSSFLRYFDNNLRALKIRFEGEPKFPAPMQMGAIRSELGYKDTKRAMSEEEEVDEFVLDSTRLATWY